MIKEKRRGFTLIELIAVLVILAILALIVTPLVMNIIKKAKYSANKRSVDAYGRSIELAIAEYLLDTGTFPTDLSSLTIEYTGKEVSCNVMQMKENGGVYLSECSVNGKEVKDSNTEDGWYHYGTRDLTNEEYVDMYGLALKNASVAYYEANGNPVEDYRTLTVDYKGKTVTCDVTVNYNGTIYMTKCKVNNVDVISDTEDGYYHYGSIEYKTYEIGDTVNYNGTNYYVIKNSSGVEDSVTILKGVPLTTEEINIYGGVGTDNNRVNRYTNSSTGEAYDHVGYGAMAFYSTDTCNERNRVYTGCTNDYELSDVKYVVDAWAVANTNELDLIEDSSGYKVRILSKEDLVNYLGYKDKEEQYISDSSNGVTPYWVIQYDGYNINNIWTMTTYPRYQNQCVWVIQASGSMAMNSIYTYNVHGSAVRPVITIKKSAI